MVQMNIVISFNVEVKQSICIAGMLKSVRVDVEIPPKLLFLLYLAAIISPELKNFQTLFVQSQLPA